jgi:hypothetical protein
MLREIYVLIDDVGIPYGWVNWRGTGRQAQTIEMSSQSLPGF